MKKVINIYALFLLCLIFCAGKLSAQSFCGDIPIDDFSSSTVISLDVDEAEPLVQAVDDGGSGVVGRFRSITFERLVGVSPSDGATLLIEGDRIGFSNDPGARSRANLLYDADGAGLGLDLSSRELIQLSIVNLDLGIDLTYILTDEAANQASLTEAASAISDPNVSFLFEDFAGIQNLDLSAIESVELIIESTTDSADASLEAVSFGCQEELPEFFAVPTMTGFAYVVLVLSLLLLGALWVRKSAANVHR